MNYISSILYLIGVAILAAILYTTIGKNHNPATPYQSARLVFNHEDPEQQSRYAVREDVGKFLFASGASKQIGPALFFHSTDKVNFQIQAIYDKQRCDQSAIGKSIISFSTKLGKNARPMEGVSDDLKLSVIAGDQIRVSLSNPIDNDCGRAMLWLTTDVHLLRHVVFFCLIWSSLIVLLGHFNLGFLGLWGAGIHTSIMISEMLYQQPINQYIGVSTLYALTAIGLVLTMLAVRLGKLPGLIVFIFATLVFYGLPLINFGNFWAYENALDSDSIHAILQSNLAEILQFMSDSFTTGRLLIVGGCLVGVTFFAIHVIKKSVTSIALGALGIALLALVATFSQEIRVGLATIKVANNSALSYFRELDSYHNLAAKRAKINSSYKFTRVGSKRVTVLIIGESHNKNHMSLYGYPRSTTPLLEEQLRGQNLIAFDNGYSNHTHTVQSLSLSLTEANQYSEKYWIELPSIINLANQAGIGTYWISNQQMLGVWDNSVSLLAKETDQLHSMNKRVGVYKQPKNDDEILIEPFVNSLADEGEKLIVVHLMGSHASYCLRYPSNHQFFNEKLDPGLFGKLSDTTDSDRVNCYDNSVRYNDWVLTQLFDALNSSKISASALYFADHSENAFSGAGHNQSVFDFSMIEIPVLFWATEKWKGENPEKWTQLNHNRNKLFTNDLVFETLVGLMGIEESTIDKTNDLSSSDYVEPANPTTLHGRIRIDAENNFRYWQHQNAKLVSKQNLENRLLPHRVNSVGKLLDLSSAGFKSFEMDIIFRSDGGEQFFEVGHDNSSLSGIRLFDFLSKVPADFETIWLDLKNASTENMPGIANRLQFLDATYKIKNRVIVETGNPTASPSVLTDLGFHTSYYLPTAKVLSTQSQDKAANTELAKSLVETALSQRAAAVSFDLRLYEFVKNHLEALLPESIKFHTWSPGVTFADPKLLEKLSGKDFFSDPKVKTILLPYVSDYTL